MPIKQKNCLLANLGPILLQHQVQPQDLFWALVDIDIAHYPRYLQDWVPCYLTELGVYTDRLWVESQALHFEDLQQQIRDREDSLQLIIVPMKNIAYRYDIGNQMRPNQRHALLIHQDKTLSLEDLAVGNTGEMVSMRDLQEQQFVFPFNYWTFDSAKFMHSIFSIPLQKQISDYANRIISKWTLIQEFKQQLLIQVLLNKDLDGLIHSNLFEESYYYRAYYIEKKAKNLVPMQEQYIKNLSRFKGLFLRMQHTASSDAIGQLQNKAIHEINQLSELDHEFYNTFAQHRFQ